MSGGKRLRIEVAYALPGAQVLVAVEVEEGTTVREAIERSGIAARCPGVEVTRARVGIWGKAVGPDAKVSDGDRIEIYRPLKVDPGEVRRLRARLRRRDR